MKKLVCLLCVVLLAVACKNTGKPGEPDGKRVTSKLAPVSGKLNQIMVIINNNIWEASVGDTLRAWFGQLQEGLPQDEPIFDLMHLPKVHFNNEIKSHRNILQVEISSSKDSASIQFIDSPWANTQKMVVMEAPNREEWLKLFDANKKMITYWYSKAERDRLMSVYKRTADPKIYQLLKEKYHVLLYAPTGYYVRKDTAGFVWFSQETQKYSQGVCFFTEPYTDQHQFDHIIIMDKVDEMLKKYFKGPLPGTYMALDQGMPYSVLQHDYNGHYAMTLRGIWTMENDFMAGPYLLNVVLDEAQNRLVYIMGYVYYPSEPKRNMMKQLEALINTMSVDFAEKSASQS